MGLIPAISVSKSQKQAMLSYPINLLGYSTSNSLTSLGYQMQTFLKFSFICIGLFTVVSVHLASQSLTGHTRTNTVNPK